MYITNICMEIDKNAPWLVLIHGFGGTRKMWKHQIEQFSDSYNIMIIELPGHGDSICGLADEKGLHINDVSQSVCDLLYDKKIDRADFICVSLGTLIMAGIAELHPEVVNKVILCGAVFGMKSSAKIILHIGNLLKPFFPYMITIRALATVLMPKKAHKLSRKFLVSECRKLGRKEFMKWYSIICHEMDLLKENLDKFTDNALVVMGSEDHVFLKKAIKNVEKKADDIKLTIMKNCGHVCSLQKWREFNFIACSYLEIEQTSAIINN